MAEIEYILDFDDRTLLESDGDFEYTKALMEKESLGHEKWMLESKLQMSAMLGGRLFYSLFVLHFYHTGDIYIMEYMPSTQEIFTNPDINGLYSWATGAGWKRILPCDDIIREQTEFWRHFWETHLVDSDYLDKNFGNRDKIEQEEYE